MAMGTKMSAAMCLAMAIGACSSEVSRGAEYAEPADGKADSFYRPTEHGGIAFGESPEWAEISAEERFHAWTFRVAGEATIEARTAGDEGDEVDTVMYLYKRQEDGSWGRYVGKNDDADNSTSLSAISHETDGGEFRVLIKGYGASDFGTFGLAVTCDGDCEAPAPAPTDFTASCAAQFHEIVTSTLTSSTNTTYAAGESAPSGPASVALESFRAINAEEWGDEEVELSVRTLARGTVVGATFGSDWSYEYVFDAADVLLLEFFVDQSSSATWYCGEAGEAALEEPNVDCVAQAIWLVDGEGGDASDIFEDTEDGVALTCGE